MQCKCKVATWGSNLTEHEDNSQHLRYLATAMRLEMKKVKFYHEAELRTINSMVTQKNELNKL